MTVLLLNYHRSSHPNDGKTNLKFHIKFESKLDFKRRRRTVYRLELLPDADFFETGSVVVGEQLEALPAEVGKISVTEPDRIATALYYVMTARQTILDSHV